MDTFSLLVLLLYFGGFVALAIGVGLLPMGWRFGVGIAGFHLLSMACLDWWIDGEEGPAVLSMIALHGLVHWLLYLTLLLRATVMAWRRLRAWWRSSRWRRRAA